MTGSKSKLHKLLRIAAVQAAACITLGACSALAAEPGSTVVVVYNRAMPESKQVATYYAQRRDVPESQVLGFDLPPSETISRTDYLAKLEQPFLEQLREKKLFTFGTNASTRSRLTDSKIRYAVLCYGVPTKILADASLKEEGEDKIQLELRRNDASVDSQLACVPLPPDKVMWSGVLANPFYTVSNRFFMQPTNGVLMVTRLDGPSPEIARGLVDKAMDAETNGLWGRAYIDSRGLTNGAYKLGDDWMRETARLCKRLGFDTDLDEKPETFSAAYPMSQIGFYAGWYDQGVSGPFTRQNVEFMPGAFAYHLHSFNARVLRTSNDWWTGPLLAKGATITFGSVEEPFLSGTPDIPTFFLRLVYLGFSFGEAACASQSVLSWQTIAIGDPLYRPYGTRPEKLHADLEQRQSKYLQWSHLRVVMMNLASGADLSECIEYLESIPLTKTSAILTEKLGDLYWSKKKLSDALDLYEKVLKLDPSPQEKLRVLLNVANRRTYLGQDPTAYSLYQQVLNEYPDYPDRLAVCQKLLGLAQKLQKPADAERWQREITRLSAPAGTPARNS